MRTNDELNGVSLLGNQNTKYVYDHPHSEMLEVFDNKHQDRIYLVEFKCPEFTSLCVSGDTIIDVCCDESKNPHGIEIKNLVDTEGYLFSFDVNTFQPIVKKYHSVRKTQKLAKVLEIKMVEIHGNGKNRHEKQTSIKVTPNHPILIRTGHGLKCEWIEAKDLKPGMRIVSDQRSSDTIRNNSRHRLIAQTIFKDFDENMIVYHKDHNHYNNSIDNIGLMPSNSLHFSHHQSLRYGYDDKIDEIKLIDQYVNENMSILQLGQYYHCDYSTVASRLLKNGIKLKSQSDILIGKRNIEFYQKREMCKQLYEQGYTIYELGQYFNVHETTISKWITAVNGNIRTAVETKEIRDKITLPALNHKIISIEDCEAEDVYNMEVEDTECYFGNGIVLHNCPKTGQPDFATIYVRYIPRVKMVESKSLKLYLFSYRNHGDFHEDCTNTICKHLTEVMDPYWIRVIGDFVPRGGISIATVAEYTAEGFIVPTHFAELKEIHNRHL